LKRSDLGGKTGTTNDSHDAWFAGYANEGEVAIAWIGFDQPRSLGDRENGGGLSLPIWITYMQTALKGVPEKERAVPQGIINVAGEYYYSEFGPSQSVVSLGLDDPVAPPAGENPATPPPPPPGAAAPAGAAPSPVPAPEKTAPQAPREVPQPVPYGTLRN
jgi:penicillin-binding protein 1A